MASARAVKSVLFSAHVKGTSGSGVDARFPRNRAGKGSADVPPALTFRSPLERWQHSRVILSGARDPKGFGHPRCLRSPDPCPLGVCNSERVLTPR